MKRYLGPLLCALCAAACSTNKPAEMPQATAQSDSTTPLLTTHDPAASADGSVAPSPTGAEPAGNAASTATAPHANGPAASDARPASEPASSTDYKTMDAAVGPDNTKVNKRDTKSSTVTPLDQGESQADLDITKKIRQAVVGDHSLSFTAKNVKIITRDGKVTLRGPVNTTEERNSIQAAAAKVAGSSNVDNQLEVKK